MFSKRVATSWGWDPSDDDFPDRLRSQLQELGQCNATLYKQPGQLKALPADELLAYLQNCFKNAAAMSCVHNSLYAPCALALSKFVPKSQLLFLKYEDLLRMQPRALLRT